MRIFSRLSLGLVAAVAVAGPASAAFRWDFEVKPSREIGIAAWPQAARARGLEGSAVAICKAREGRLADCEVVWESVAGEGFGDALLGLAPLYRMKGMSMACEAAFPDVAISYEWSAADQKADWRRRPDEASFWRAYPRAALKAKTWGATLISCAVQTDGELRACRVLRETPEGQGFGPAALSLTPRFAIRPAAAGGQPAVSSVTIPINFIPYPTVCQR